jgi:hypothetical protein
VRDINHQPSTSNLQPSTIIKRQISWTTALLTIQIPNQILVEPTQLDLSSQKFRRPK